MYSFHIVSVVSYHTILSPLVLALAILGEIYLANLFNEVICSKTISTQRGHHDMFQEFLLICIVVLTKTSCNTFYAGCYYIFKLPLIKHFFRIGVD